VTTLNGGSFTAPRQGRVGGSYFKPFWFEVDEPIKVLRATGVVTTPGTYKDRTFLSANTTNVEDVVWTFSSELDRPAPEAITRSSSNESVLAPDPANPFKWTYVGPGTATLTLTCPARTVNRTVTAATTTSTVRSNYGLASASAAKAAADAIDTRLAATTLEASWKRIYDSQNHAAATYVRNTNCWAALGGLDLTSISPWNSTGANQRAGTLVTPRHILYASHFPISVGATVRFVRADNTVVTRTVTASTLVSGDCSLAVLDSDVGAGIGFAKVLGPGSTAKLPVPTTNQEALDYPWRVPLLALDQEEKALVTDAYVDSNETWSNQVPVDLNRISFYEPLIGGDSGNPGFLLIGNQLVLVTTWLGGGPGSGPSIPALYAKINAAISALGNSGGYQLTPVDLSSYPSY